MKNLISRIRNKRLKGNVSLLVILILLASSVISLLSINQIQHLITYGNMTFNYFRAFYLAKAWNELALTEIYNRENWFESVIENEIVSDDTIVFDQIIEDNFLWEEKKYEWFKPYFNMEIVSNFYSIGNDVRYTCDDDNKITLNNKHLNEKWEEISWEGIVLQLFKDNTSQLEDILNFDYTDRIDSLDNGDITKLKFDKNPEWNLMFWLFGYKDWDMTDIIVESGNSLNSFLVGKIWISDWKINWEWKRLYLSIKNIWDNPVDFCVVWNNKIPYSNYLVTVRGNYADMEVWLQSVVKKDIPSWSLDLVGMNSSS